MVSAANYQEIHGGVKVLRQKDETKKKEKKIAETEVETKTSKFFSDFQTVLLSEQEDVAVIPFPDFTKKQQFREQNNEILETGLLTF
jgi:hypothetical protein